MKTPNKATAPSASVSPAILKDVLTVQEVADELRLSPRTVQRLCTRGALAYIPITRTLFRIRRRALDEFISNREVSA